MDAYTIPGRFFLYLPLFLGVSAVPAFATAITLTITPNAKYSDSTAPCANVNGAWPGCGVNSFLSPTAATSITDFMSLDTFGRGQALPGGTDDIDFAAAYDGWLLGNPGWSTLETGTLAGSLALDVDIFTSIACPGKGGLGTLCSGSADTGIEVQISNYTPGAGDPALNQFFWVQGLLTNYHPPGLNTSNVYLTMDTADFSHQTCDPLANPANGTSDTAGTTYCGPAYPYQYSDRNFDDAPKGPYPNGSFRGIALLATEETVNNVNTLTVYGGVNYGFDLYVTPEPGTLILCLGGFATAVLWRRRHRASR